MEVKLHGVSSQPRKVWKYIMSYFELCYTPNDIVVNRRTKQSPVVGVNESLEYTFPYNCEGYCRIELKIKVLFENY